MLPDAYNNIRSMKMLRTISFLLLTTAAFLIMSCNKETNSDKKYPSDYMYMQRAYPKGKIDLKAYQNALKSTQINTSVHKDYTNPWLSQGPDNISGRITDIEMPYDNQDIIYAGSASGGIFQSSDRGISWTPIFDDNPSLSIGDIAIDRQNPNLLYVGTGESNAGGGSLAYDGNGIYKSDDAGTSWKSCGLEEVGSIGRIVIDPNDADIVTVAAMGHLFSNNTQRGVFQSRDGGDSWQQKLFLSDSTGAIDLAIHPQNGDILYAAMWERIRRPHNRQYGGATSGLYRSVDGGESWIELTVGLPDQAAEKGRIGISISESDPDILYAVYAGTAGNLQGIYKTTDGGESWSAININGIANVPFMWWFGKITIDPNDPDVVYVASIDMFRTIDGGDNWEQVFADAHVDHHALYIHPQNSDLVINGNDGGVNIGVLPDMFFSQFASGISNFQFYTCEINPHNPSILYGGAQDNGTNIQEDDTDSWRRLFGGDGFVVLIDPNDADQLYLEFQNGNIFGSSDGGITFYNATRGITGAANWKAPIAMDPNQTEVLYTGTQSLFRTTDKANQWTKISDDLVNADNPSGNLEFGTLTTIDVSSHDSDVIYIGTDDGNAWVTRDGGSSYTDISEGLPQRWMTSISHDPLDPAGVYISVSGFRFGESLAQVYYSDDYGSTWDAIGSPLPDIPVNDVLGDPEISGTAYAATDIGVYVTEDRGNTWQRMGTDMPVVPITDIDIDQGSRTLAAASYGRGMYTYDLPKFTATIETNSITYSIYPNPVTDYVNVDTDEHVKLIEIYDVEGKLVLSNSQKYQMNMKALYQGTYFIRVYTEKGSFTEKIVKI